jgi:DNA-binding beta-propeller fold protein YncE
MSAVAMGAWHGQATAQVLAEIPGADGSWDYATFDAAGHRVLIGRGDGITAVDLNTRKLSHLADGHEVNGSIVLADGRILMTNEGTNTVTIANGTTGAIEAAIPVGKGPDAAIYDPASGNAIVAMHEGGELSFIDTTRGKQVARLRIGGALEFMAVDGAGRLYVNEEKRSEIVVVDTRARHVTARFKLTQCQEPTALAYIPSRKALISTCHDGDAKVISAIDGRELNAIHIGPHPDVAIYDAARARVYIATAGSLSENGEVTVLKVDPDAGISLLDRIPTQRGARTAAEDPSTGLLYMPTANYVLGPNGKPTTVPGTFRVLVVDPNSHEQKDK